LHGHIDGDTWQAMTNLPDLSGSTWSGRAELWLDPAGNDALTCDCTLRIEPDSVTYTWSYEGKPQSGRLTLRGKDAVFTDTWHSPTSMPCASVAAPWCLLDVLGTYAAGGENWGWRITLALRPTGELVLQMTNVAPWGEEARAVRMVCRR